MGNYKGAGSLPRVLRDGNDDVKLSAADVCEIIKTCAREGVGKLIYGSLDVEFAPRVVTDVAIPPGSEVARPLTPEEKRQLDLELAEAEKKAKLELELLYKRERLDNMVIEDPAQFEELIASGDLTNEGSEESIDRGA